MNMAKKSQKEWTMSEIKLIKENHLTTTKKRIAKQLGRSISSVQHVAYELGISFKREWEVSEYSYYKGDDLICSGSVFDISDETGIPVKNLLLYRHESYMKRLHRRLVMISD